MRLFITAGWIALASCLYLTPASAADKLTPNMEQCKITFVGSKPNGESHTGGFKKFKIDAQADFETPANSKILIEITTESLFADNPKLEAHLKNADFFDVRKYPTATFESTQIEASETEAMLTGKLTLLGKTGEVKIPLQVEHGENQLKLTGKFKLDRAKWGMNYGLEGNKINKDVDVAVELAFSH